MTARKQKFTSKSGASYVANAKERWDGAPPEWVVALAHQADQDGNQDRTAKRCGFKSASVVSAVINKRYPGRLDRIETCVRGALMAQTVNCPVLGTIASNDCVEHQGRKFSAASPQRAQLAQACLTCPNALKGAKHAQH